MGEFAYAEVKSCFSEPFCLCLGAGVTKEFVGDWNMLLGKLLARRFASGWATQGDAYNDVADHIDASDLMNFFQDEGPLAIGEFLLADEALDAPRRFSAHQPAWQERFFSRHVADVVRESVAARLHDYCTDMKCVARKKCPLHAKGKHSLSDMYGVYKHMTGFAADNDSAERSCAYLKKALTTMSVVELCARLNVRGVVNYNFDTVVEEMLCDAIAHGLVSTDIKEIHIWTYGETKIPKVQLGHPECPIILHRGGWTDGAPDLSMAGDSIHFFHVHGVAAGASVPDVGDQLVFSQHSYRIYQESPFNWSNQVLQYVLAKNKLIAIGFSGTDENFRSFAWNYRKSMVNRLTLGEKGMSDRIVFLKSSGTHDEVAKRIAEQISDDAKRKRMRQYLGEHSTGVVQKYYQDYYGVHTVWVKDYETLAKALHAAANAKSMTMA